MPGRTKVLIALVVVVIVVEIVLIFALTAIGAWWASWLVVLFTSTVTFRIGWKMGRELRRPL